MDSPSGAADKPSGGRHSKTDRGHWSHSTCSPLFLPHSLPPPFVLSHSTPPLF